MLRGVGSATLPADADGVARWALPDGRGSALGAHVDGDAVELVVWSQNATGIDWCGYDATGTTEIWRAALHPAGDGLWRARLPAGGVGLVYGLRAAGPAEPERGHLFDPSRVLLDPYAREIVAPGSAASVASSGPTVATIRAATAAGETATGVERADDAAPLERGAAAPVLPAATPDQPPLLARIPVPRAMPAGLHAYPRHALRDLVLYEVHVRNFTRLHPGVPAHLRGTYAGMAHPAAIAHLQRLGVTTVSLLPVHYHQDEGFLARLGLVNHWGYNTIGFFCPDPRYAVNPHDAASVDAEFRQMVATLHLHGIEVVLDVVYNHTSEAGSDGPVVSFRGLDNSSWYRLVDDAPQHAINWSGCGNTLNAAHPRVAQFIIDSLRHWREHFGVDGFRFDLAPILGRNARGEFDPNAPLFVALAQDAVLRDVHLISEPWDAGPGGYQVGRFPGRWLEWNDRFRDSMRRLWLPPLQSGVDRGEYARRFTASNDLFQHGNRRPTTSINFVTAHDGFTLADLTSYQHKHNEANGEDNRDGRSDEFAWHFGVEGPTDDERIVAMRSRVRRSILMTLLLAQGIPMLLSGDEFANSQSGNNNAWNQDNPTTWLDWQDADQSLASFVAGVIAARRHFPALRHDRWFRTPDSALAQAHGEASAQWRLPDGTLPEPTDWHDGKSRALAMLIDGFGSLFVAFNPDDVPRSFALPELPQGWTMLLDSATGAVHPYLGSPAAAIGVSGLTHPQTPSPGAAAPWPPELWSSGPRLTQSLTVAPLSMVLLAALTPDGVLGTAASRGAIAPAPAWSGEAAAERGGPVASSAASMSAAASRAEAASIPDSPSSTPAAAPPPDEPEPPEPIPASRRLI